MDSSQWDLWGVDHSPQAGVGPSEATDLCMGECSRMDGDTENPQSPNSSIIRSLPWQGKAVPLSWPCASLASSRAEAAAVKESACRLEGGRRARNGAEGAETDSQEGRGAAPRAARGPDSPFAAHPHGNLSPGRSASPRRRAGF